MRKDPFDQDCVRERLARGEGVEAVVFLHEPCRNIARAEKLHGHFLPPRRRRGERRAVAAHRHHRRLGVIVGSVDRRSLERLRAEPDVAGVALGSEMMPIISSPGAPQTSPAEVAWGVARLKVPEVWARGFTGKSVLVGHLDTGVDGGHGCLADSVSRFAVVGFFGSCHERELPSFDTGFHGTYTAGIAVGRAFDGQNIGVAPAATLCSAVVIEGGSSARRVFDALGWVMGTGIRVLNLSVGFPGYLPYLKSLFTTIRLRGILPVIAVGNRGEGNSTWPGNYDEALSVGAATQDNKVWENSSSDDSHGDDPPVPDLVAPGDAIPAPQRGDADTYVETSGTSMATPHVAGLAALLWQAKPAATVDEVESAILSSCVPLPDVDAARQGRGMPNAVAALDALLSG